MLTSWNLFLQSFSFPFLDQVFLGISYLGNELIFMSVIATVYLCIDKYKGLHLALGLVSSFTLNSGIKSWIKVPRPFTYTPELRRIDTVMSPGYSFPSAHAQLSSTLASGITYFYGKSGIFFIVLSLLIGLSRVYLGVHTPVDVIAGLLGGALWMLCSIYLSKKILQHHKIFILLYLVPCYLFYFVNHDINLLKLTAVFTAFLIGFLLEDTYLHYETSIKIPSVLKLFLLLIGCAFIKFPLKILLPDLLICTYISYFLIGIWISLFCPWLLLLIDKRNKRHFS